MIGCPRCKFVSDPLTGDIYDARTACPKCGFSSVGPSKKPTGLGNTSSFNKVTSVSKLAGLGAAFYYARKVLADIEAGETRRNRQIKNMLGEMLPAIKRSTLYLPAFGLPSAVSLATNDEYPILSTLYALGIGYMMITTAASPILGKAAPAPSAELI